MLQHKEEDDVESFLVFLKTVLLSLSSACFCVSDAPVKAQHFVPQTNMSTDESQNNIHTNKFYICKWCCQHSVSQGFQSYFLSPREIHVEELGEMMHEFAADSYNFVTKYRKQKDKSFCGQLQSWVVVQWFVLSCHSKKILGLNPDLSVWSLRVLPVFMWVSSGYAGFLSPSKDKLWGLG